MSVVIGMQQAEGLDGAIVEVEEQLSLVFRRARAIWKDAASQVHPELQPVGYKILGTIARLGETNAHALAELFDTDKSVVSRQVRMLEEAGLIVSRPDEKDGRARVLSPTARANERIQAARAQQHNRLREVLSTLPEAEVRAFARMLALLNSA